MSTHNNSLFSRKLEEFKDWFGEKEHRHSKLNKTVFFHDLLKLIGLILVFLIVYYNVDKLNQIVLIFIKVGSLIELVLLFFIFMKAWHLIRNLKYYFRGLSNGAKAVIAIVIVLLLLVAFLNQDKVVTSVIDSYGKMNITKLSPVKTDSLGFSFGNFSFFKGVSVNKIKCQADFDEDIRKAKVKNPQLSVKIIERKSIWDLKEALDFVDGWNANNEQGTLNYLRNNFNVQQTTIDLILYRVDDQICIDSCIPYSELKFAVCNGETTRYPQATLGDAVSGFFGG